ncbi:hypothetical protein CT0861_11124, partial [Colletotrichum tofieldiae]
LFILFFFLILTLLQLPLLPCQLPAYKTSLSLSISLCPPLSRNRTTSRPTHDSILTLNATPPAQSKLYKVPPDPIRGDPPITNFIHGKGQQHHHHHNGHQRTLCEPLSDLGWQRLGREPPEGHPRGTGQGGLHHDCPHGGSRGRHRRARQGQAHPRPQLCRLYWPSQCRLVRGQQGGHDALQRDRHPEPHRRLLPQGHPLHRLRHRLHLPIRRRPPHWRARLPRDRPCQLQGQLLLGDQGSRRGGHEALQQLPHPPPAHARQRRLALAQLRHQDRQVRPGRRYPQQQHDPPRPPPRIDPHGRAQGHGHLQLHQPRRHLAQRGALSVQGDCTPRLHVEELLARGAVQGHQGRPQQLQARHDEAGEEAQGVQLHGARDPRGLPRLLRAHEGQRCAVEKNEVGLGVCGKRWLQQELEGVKIGKRCCSNRDGKFKDGSIA